MNPVFAAILALLLAVTPTSTLQRHPHDDTIYIVRGTPEQLAQFRSDLSNWGGGMLLTKDDGADRYWAFSDRTAPQAREFMFGAMRAGLFLDIIPYDERISFRAERKSLDEIAISCGFTRDPFFITPAGELTLSLDAADPEAVRCANDKLQASPLRNMIVESAK